MLAKGRGRWAVSQKGIIFTLPSGSAIPVSETVGCWLPTLTINVYPLPNLVNKITNDVIKKSNGRSEFELDRKLRTREKE